MTAAAAAAAAAAEEEEEHEAKRAAEEASRQAAAEEADKTGAPAGEDPEAAAEAAGRGEAEAGSPREEGARTRRAKAAARKWSEEAKRRQREQAAQEAAAAAAKQTEQDEAAMKAARERERAWKRKTPKEREDLARRIHAAAKGGSGSEVQALLDSGCGVDAEDGDGWTPLLRAAEMGDTGLVELLLQSGANAKAAVKLGEWGQTALHFAARKGNKEAAELLAPKSDVKAKNYLGKTASETARAEGHRNLARWLRGLERRQQ
uniref:Uncharacterized protein n=1 Tax=Alexandrium monilatum TaxID=311494 RepID=A0A7S4SGY5_9DINO